MGNTPRWLRFKHPTINSSMSVSGIMRLSVVSCYWGEFRATHGMMEQHLGLVLWLSHMNFVGGVSLSAQLSNNRGVNSVGSSLKL